MPADHPAHVADTVVAPEEAGLESATTVQVPPPAPSAGKTAPDRRRTSDRHEPTSGSLHNEVKAARADPKKRFGRFLLLSELGRGGMGIVYRAWDDRLKRVMALKTILPGDEAGKAAIKRFYREAEAVARLRHPGIVAVHEVGELEGRHFLVMDLVDGASFEKRLRAKLPLTKGLEVLRDVARAVHYAHEQGVVHRDLKPQNVMIDQGGRAFVLDFGLARVRDSGDASKITKTGAALGTPAYMPPEQCGESGHAVDERSDVWSLGATLYHVLAGRPPFTGSPLQLMAQVVSRDPVPPGSLNARARGELETICLKCLEKEKEKRYASAAALADDLDAYLAGEPIAARPLGLPARILRLARRKKAAAGLLLVAVASLVVGGGVAVQQAFERVTAERESLARIEKALDAEKAASKEAQESLRLARLNLSEALAGQADLALERGEVQMAMLHLGRARDACDTLRLRASGLALPRLLVTARGHEAYEGAVQDLVRLRDGRPLAVVAAEDGVLVVRDIDAGREVARLRAEKRRWNRIAFSPDGTLIATAHHLPQSLWSNEEALGAWKVALWNGGTGALSRTLPAHANTNDVAAVAFSPDGRTLATVGATTCELWDVDAAERRFVLPAGEKDDDVTTVAFSTDGKLLATAGGGLVKLWDPATGTFLRQLMRDGGDVRAIVFSPDGRRLAGAGSLDVHVWETGGKSAPLRLHTEGRPRALAFAPDGATLVTGGSSEVQLWDTASAQCLRRVLAHDRDVSACLFSPDGRGLLTSGADGVRRWSIEERPERPTFRGRERSLDDFALSPTTATVALVGGPGSVEILSLETGKVTVSLSTMCGGGGTAAFSPDGKTIAVGETPVSLWDSATGSLKRRLETPHATIRAGPSMGVRGIAFSSTGNLLAAACLDGSVEVWEVATSRSRWSAKLGEFHEADEPAFSPDERILACPAMGEVALYEVSSGRPIRKLATTPSSDVHMANAGGSTRMTSSHGVRRIAFSPDGKLLAAPNGDSVRVWDGGTWDLAFDLRGHRAPVVSVAFSPDGRLLASWSLDMTAKLWDVAARGELKTLKGHGGGPSRIAFSRDGGLLGMLDEGGLVLWGGQLPSTLKEIENLTGLALEGVRIVPSR
ncbi:protein kinase [bacterium]|nr:protein kinase [bacterium]